MILINRTVVSMLLAGIELVNPLKKNVSRNIVSKYYLAEDVAMSTGRSRIEEIELKHLESRYRKESDYKATTAENVSVCEVNGNNPARSQEDAVAVNIPSATSDAFMALSRQDKTKVTEATFTALQDNLDPYAASNCGSCACVATGQVKDNKATVYTSYVGDSVAFLVVLSADGKLKSVTPCNPALHDGNNAVERVTITRGIERNKGVIAHNRLCARPEDGMLAVTRALGDNAFFDYGLLHTPQTTEITVDVTPGDQVYMIVACDGAMEHCKGVSCVATYAKELGLLFENHHNLSPEGLAQEIVDYALKKGSMDNITALVAPLKADKSAVTAGVFDGHGGSYVSQHVSTNFNGIFQHNVDHVNDIKKKRQIFKRSDNHGNVKLKDDKKDVGTNKRRMAHAQQASEETSSYKMVGLGAGIGVFLGAIIGSAIAPGIGTAIGAVVGGLLGGAAGVCLNHLNSRSRMGVKKKSEIKMEPIQGISSHAKPAMSKKASSTAMLMECGYTASHAGDSQEPGYDPTMEKTQKNPCENQLPINLIDEIKNERAFSPTF